MTLATAVALTLLSCQEKKVQPALSHADVIKEIAETIEVLEAMEKADRAPAVEIEERLMGIKASVEASFMQESEAELLLVGLDFLIPAASMQRKAKPEGEASDAAYYREQLQKLHDRFK